MVSAPSTAWRLAAGAACTLGALAVVAWWRRRRLCVRISRLCVYPIKSCRGHSLAESRLTAEGLAHDREYAVIKVTEGKVKALTQREVPLLVTIAPDMPTASGIVVHKAGMRSLVVPTCSDVGAIYSITSHEWWDVVRGEDQGDEAAAWFCEALNDSDIRLVRFTGSRPTPEPERFGEGLTLFSDGFGLLLTSEASLADLGHRTGLSHCGERMRTNIVVTGCRAYEEDRWKVLLWQSGTSWAKMLLPKPCARCTIPRVDPTTGIPGLDPLRTMKPYRSGRELLKEATPHKAHYEKNKGDIFFGQNVNTVASGDVVLRVGDALVMTM